MLTALSERISDEVVRKALWRRIHAAFNYGDVLVTMGTGKLTQSEEEGMGLAGEHDYAVIDMQERHDQQFFLLKNPWSEGTTWKGHLFLKNVVNEVRKPGDLPGITGEADLDGIDDSLLAPGTFWIGLNDVFQTFESIYVNWNPRLFSYREDTHFNWDLSTRSSSEGSLESHPQYVVRSQAGGTVWILLSRHFTSNSQRSEPGFINLCAFDNGGMRAVLSERARFHGPYVDSPNTLLKLELSDTKAFTIVVSEQALPQTRHTFTLSAFSLTSLSLYEAQEKFGFSVSQDGTWLASTAGGNASGLSYHTNPQFCLDLTRTSDLSFLLESPAKDLPIHVKLVRAKGKRVHSIACKDIIGDSGEYRKGVALATFSSVQAGVYTVVCSTFEQGQLGKFTLCVKSMSACTLRKISVASAGRFSTNVPLAVFRPGKKKLLAQLHSRRLNRVSASASSSGAVCEPKRRTFSPLKISIEHGQGVRKHVLGSSDENEFLGGRAAVLHPEIDIQPSMCEANGVWLVIERLADSGLRGDEHVRVELLSDEPVELHGWETGER